MAKLQKVKCLYCGRLIDREEEVGNFIQVKKRYAHFSCYNENYKKEQQEKEERKKLTDLIKELYWPNRPNWDMITSQIKRYQQEGMTYMGMYYTLVYFFQIEKNEVNPRNGIGIIPHKYEAARNYYERMGNTYTTTAAVTSGDKKLPKQTESIIILPPKKPREKQLIDFHY